MIVKVHNLNVGGAIVYYFYFLFFEIKVTIFLMNLLHNKTKRFPKIKFKHWFGFSDRVLNALNLLE